MIHKPVYLENGTTLAQYDTWLKRLADRTGYSLTATPSDTATRYIVTSPDGEKVAEIDALNLGGRLKIESARLGVESRTTSLRPIANRKRAEEPDGPIFMAVPGFVGAYAAAMQADFGILPETSVERFTAWALDGVVENETLPPLPQLQPAATGAGDEQLNYLETKILEAVQALRREGQPTGDEYVAARLPMNSRGKSYSREWINRNRNAMRKRGIDV